MVLAVAFLMAAGDASGLTPAEAAPEALEEEAAASLADVSLMVAESTVFWRRKKFEGAAPVELWFEEVWGDTTPVRLPAAGAAAFAPDAGAAELAVVAVASRVSPPDDARRPPAVLLDVVEMERCTLRWPPPPLAEPAADVVDEACEDEWPDDGTRDDGPDATAADSVRGGIPRSDKELPDRDPSLSNCQSEFFFLIIN